MLIIESHAECLIKEIEQVRKMLDDTKQKTPAKRRNRQAEIAAEMEPYMKWIQKKFKLKVPPHHMRVLRYLSTNDLKVFDGLKREWE